MLIRFFFSQIKKGTSVMGFFMVGNNSGPSDSSFRWVPHLKIVNLTIQNYFSPQKKPTTEFPIKKG